MIGFNITSLTKSGSSSDSSGRKANVSFVDYLQLKSDNDAQFKAINLAAQERMQIAGQKSKLELEKMKLDAEEKKQIELEKLRLASEEKKQESSIKAQESMNEHQLKSQELQIKAQETQNKNQLEMMKLMMSAITNNNKNGGENNNGI